MKIRSLPATSPEQSAQFPAELLKQWRTGCFARSLAPFRQEADSFPTEVKKVFTLSAPFADVELLLDIAETSPLGWH